MACHLKECIIDFGPLQAFWLFTFERYNGLIEGMPSNKRVVEVQFMRRFLRDIRFSSLPLPETLKEEFASHFDSPFPSSSGSLLENDCIFYHSSDVHPSHTNDYSNLTLPNQFIRSSFDDDMISTVFNLYKKLYPSLPMENIVLPSCFLKYKCMTIMNRIYYSSKNPQLYFAQLLIFDQLLLSISLFTHFKLKTSFSRTTWLVLNG